MEKHVANRNHRAAASAREDETVSEFDEQSSFATTVDATRADACNVQKKLSFGLPIEQYAGRADAFSEVG